MTDNGKTIAPTDLVTGRTRYCRRCAYPLRGLVEPRCAECGRPFDLAHRATTDPWPRFSRQRRAVLVGAGAVTVLAVALLVADRWFLPAPLSVPQRCSHCASARMANMTPIFAFTRATTDEFRAPRAASCRHEWSVGWSAGLPRSSAAGSVILVALDDARGALRIDLIERVGGPFGVPRVVGEFRWRDTPGALDVDDPAVRSGTFDSATVGRQIIAFGPFSVHWSESDDRRIWLYFGRFFGEAKPGDMRLAVIDAGAAPSLDGLDVDRLGVALKASPTDGDGELPIE